MAFLRRRTTESTPPDAQVTPPTTPPRDVPLAVADHQVLQRTRPSGADATVATPGDGRLVVSGTGVEITARASLGVAQVTLPVGGPYQIELHGSVGSWTLARDVMVGDLWVLAGDGNMAGAAPFGPEYVPHASVRVHDLQGNWRMARDPLHERLPDPIIPRGVGPGVTFGDTLVDEAGVPIGLVAAAAHGTTIADWDPGRAGDGDASAFGFLRRSLLLAGGRATGMLWYHGETDAVMAGETGVNPAVDYSYGLTRVIDEFRRLVDDPTAAVHLVQLGQYNGQHRAEVRRAWQSLRGIQARYQEVGADSVTATADLRLSDMQHLGLEAQRRLGSRLALAAIGRGAPAVDRIRLTRSQRLIVDFRDVAQSFVDVGAIVGFSVHDDTQRDVEIVAGAELSGKSQVTISLTRPPEPGESLWYGYGTTPYCQLVDRRDRALPCFGPEPLLAD